MLFLAPAATAQDGLLLHGGDVFEGHRDVDPSPRSSPSRDDFRKRTPILEKAYRRNLRTDSSDRYRHQSALFLAGKKLGYFPVSEERRKPLSKVEPELRPTGSGFNWPFTILFLGLTILLLRSGSTDWAAKQAPSRTRTTARKPERRSLRVSSLHPATSSGTHASPRR